MSLTLPAGSAESLRPVSGLVAGLAEFRPFSPGARSPWRVMTREFRCAEAGKFGGQEGRSSQRVIDRRKKVVSGQSVNRKWADRSGVWPDLCVAFEERGIGVAAIQGNAETLVAHVSIMGCAVVDDYSTSPDYSIRIEPQGLSDGIPLLPCAIVIEPFVPR